MSGGLRKLFKIAAVLAISAALLLSATFSALCLYITNLEEHMPEGEFDAVLVLGAGLHGENVSPVLRDRLDAAAEYILDNGIKTVLVSGGQGPDELVSEAYAMKLYLIKKGVDENAIIMEDKSTSTRENFFFSKPLLDEALGEDYRVLYVTNGFHCLRAGMMAEKAGFNAGFLPAQSPGYSKAANYTREYMALCWYFVYEAHV